MQTSSSIRVCVRCESTYEQAITFRVLADGTKKVWPIGEHLCPACRIKEATEQQAAWAEDNLRRAREQQEKLWAKQAGVPGLFQGKTFDNFERDLQPRAFDSLKDWNGKSLVLLSPQLYGVGKTHLVCALANRLLATTPSAEFWKDSYAIKLRQCPVLFVSENGILARIRATFNHKDDGEAEEDVYDELIKTPLLIVDDVGKVRPKDPAFLQNVYFRVVDERYTGGLPMIITTNLALADMEAHIGGASADRLREMAGRDGFIKLAGKSYRHQG